MSLVTHLRCHLVLARGLGECARHKDRVGQRLLHIHIFSRPHRCHRNGGVRMVWRRHDDCLDVFLLVEHLPEIPIHFGLRMRCEDLGRVVRIDIAQGHDILASTGLGSTGKPPVLTNWLFPEQTARQPGSAPNRAPCQWICIDKWSGWCLVSLSWCVRLARLVTGMRWAAGGLGD